MKQADVVIVGAGHGGAQCAIMLRQLGFHGAILLIGAEPELPYERPPLSKEYLAGAKPFEKILMHPEAFWAERGIEMLLGRCVTAVDPIGRKVTCDTGEIVRYGKLVWAAGGKPRQLACAGGNLSGVHYIRSRADVVAILAGLSQTRQIVIIGGGYIGLEAAAVLTTLGKKAILLEALDRVLARVAGDDISKFYEREHRAKGVELRTGIVVERLEGQEHVTAVVLAAGERIPADMVIVGIGIEPAIEPLLAAQSATDNKIVVDEFCRTTLSDIYAIGDCAAHHNPFADGTIVRLESVQNANDQATTVARDITGDPKPYQATPWFWSNQYDLRLQTVGLAAGYDQCVVRGDPDSRNFAVIYLRRGQVIALDCVNSVRDYSHGRRLVETAATPDVSALADVSRPLKSLL